MWKIIQSSVINAAVVLAVLLAYMPDLFPFEVTATTGNIAAFFAWAAVLWAAFVWPVLACALQRPDMAEAHAEAVYRMSDGKIVADRRVSIFWSIAIATAAAATGHFGLASLALWEGFWEGVALSVAKDAQKRLVRIGKAWAPPVPEAANDDNPQPTSDEAARAALDPEAAKIHDAKYGNPRDNKKAA